MAGTEKSNDVGSRVLFIIPSLNYGGAETLLLQQVDWLHKNGWEPVVAILSDHNDRQLITQLNLPEGRIIIFHSSNAVLNTSSIRFAWRHKKELINFARNHRVKNIVAHLPLAHFWGRLLKMKMPSARLLVYHHSMQYQANPLNTFGKRIFNWYQKKLAMKADDLSVCISEAVKQNIEANFIVKNPSVLYNAVPDKSGKINTEFLNLHNSPIVKLVLPGRLHAVKGQLFFLEVFKQLIKESPTPLRLVIAGGGPLEEEITRFIQNNGLANYVLLTGFVSNDILLRQMAEAHLVVIPSHSEGLGLVGVEALMLGKTVVTSDAGGLKEVFIHGQNGYIFEAGSYQSCLNIMRSVLSNLPNSLLSPTMLRQDYERRFSFDAYIKIFEGLLKKG